MDGLPRALALLSGGLDSALAAKIVKDQGIDVVALHFSSPFIQTSIESLKELANELEIPLAVLDFGREHLKAVRSPKRGYGSGMNPCVDCRVSMLRKAKGYARKVKASFLITGDVLGQRPLSQRLEALKAIEREAGLEGKILRPLSAKLLPETEMERKGWVDRAALLGLRGRSRKVQLELARRYEIRSYQAPSGGCLLTYREYSAKLRDLIEHKRRVTMRDVQLLKIGRHFRFKNNKIIVGRNEAENKLLLELKRKHDFYFNVPNYGSPITILQGPKSREAIILAARLTARYSDSPSLETKVLYGRDGLEEGVVVKALSDEEASKLRVY